MSDAERERFIALVQRVLDGDPEAFAGELYQLLHGIGDVCARRRIACPDDRAFCVNLAVWKFYRAIWKPGRATQKGGYRGPANRGVESYFRKTVRNVVRDWLKKQRRHRERLGSVAFLDDPDSDEPKGDEPSPPDSLADMETLKRLEWAIQQLSPEHRVVVELRKAGRRLRYIAVLLRTSVQTVRRRYAEALDELRRLMDEGPEPT